MKTFIRKFAFAASGLVLGLTCFAGSASAQTSYSWSLACQNGPEGGGYAAASWSWTQNGAPIASAATPPACYGTATQGGLGIAPPAGADGYSLTLSVCVQPLYTSPDCQSKSAVKSFSPGQSFSTTLNSSVSAKSPVICFTKCGNKTITLSESATFTVGG